MEPYRPVSMNSSGWKASTSFWILAMHWSGVPQTQLSTQAWPGL